MTIIILKQIACQCLDYSYKLIPKIFSTRNRLCYDKFMNVKVIISTLSTSCLPFYLISLVLAQLSESLLNSTHKLVLICMNAMFKNCFNLTVANCFK